MTGAKSDLGRDGEGERKAGGDMLLAIKQAEVRVSFNKQQCALSYLVTDPMYNWHQI